MTHGPPSTGKVRALQQGAENGGIIGEHGMVDSGRSVSDAPILTLSHTADLLLAAGAVSLGTT